MQQISGTRCTNGNTAVMLKLNIETRYQFHQRYPHAIFRQLFSSYMKVEKAAKKTFVPKMGAFNVDEIDTRDQFHHNFIIR
jgi:hypothetical protein